MFPFLSLSRLIERFRCAKCYTIVCATTYCSCAVMGCKCRLMAAAKVDLGSTETLDSERWWYKHNDKGLQTESSGVPSFSMIQHSYLWEEYCSTGFLAAINLCSSCCFPMVVVGCLSAEHSVVPLEQRRIHLLRKIRRGFIKRKNIKTERI